MCISMYTTISRFDKRTRATTKLSTTTLQREIKIKSNTFFKIKFNFGYLCSILSDTAGITDKYQDFFSAYLFHNRSAAIFNYREEICFSFLTLIFNLA